jgi:hypothetical protein
MCHKPDPERYLPPNSCPTGSVAMTAPPLKIQSATIADELVGH